MADLTRRTACALLASWLVGAFGISGAGASDDRRYWVDRWNELRAKRDRLASELEDARIEYRRGRIGNRGRGPDRAKLLERIDKLERDLASAEEELEEFPERARRAGALPGWFR